MAIVDRTGWRTKRDISSHLAPELAIEGVSDLQEDRLLGHSTLEGTERYLGVDVHDALAIFEQVEL